MAELFNCGRIKWSDIIDKKDLETAKESFIHALKTDKSYVREYKIMSKAGDLHWIQERGQIICDDKGEIERDSNGNPYLECMCGNILCERIDTSKHFFTEKGSFWSNNTSKLLA